MWYSQLVPNLAGFRASQIELRIAAEASFLQGLQNDH